MSAIELVVVHLLLPWETVRLVLDIVSLWGLLWMLGLPAGVKVFPHVLDDAGLRLRHSLKAAVDVLGLPVLKQTRVDVTLHGPTRVGGAEGHPGPGLCQ